MRKLLLGAAAAAMVAGGTVAQAAPVAEVRSGSPVADADNLGGGSVLWLGLLAAVLLGVALWGINDNDADDGFPVSP